MELLKRMTMKTSKWSLLYGDRSNSSCDRMSTPTASRGGSPSPPGTPTLATAPGPSQLLTSLLIRLPDATNRSLIDQAAVDFAFLNSKAARKRLVKVG